MAKELLKKICYFLLALALVSGFIYFDASVFSYDRLWIVVVIQVTLVSTATLIHALLYLSVQNAMMFFISAYGISLGIELFGTRYGTPFHSVYWYADFMGPKLFGLVPVIIPLCWFCLAYICYFYVSSIQYNFLCCRSRNLRWVMVKLVLCAFALMSFDLLLDPVGTATGAWRWRVLGLYYGTPIGSFLGWFLTGLIIYGVYFLYEFTHTQRSCFEQDLVFKHFAGAVAIVLAYFCGIINVLHGQTLALLIFTACLLPYWIFWGIGIRRELRNRGKTL